MMTALLLRSFRRARGLLLSLAIVLAVFQVLVVIAAQYLQEQRAFSQVVALLPVLAQQLIGGLFSSFDAMAAFGYFHPVVVIAFVGTAIVMGSEPAADVEAGVVDLVLARPLSRRQLVTRSVLATMLATLGLAAVMLAASSLTLASVRPSDSNAASIRIIAKTAANLVAVAWSLGALSLACASLARRRATAAGSAGVAGVALYLLNALADLSSRYRPYGPLSPFHYFQPMTIVTGGTRWVTDVALLLAVSIVLAAGAYVAWSRRDL